MGETNIFKVLADSQRRDILTMLKNGRLNAGEIAEELQITPAALSYHLKLLKSADLVSEYKEKNFVYYDSSNDSSCSHKCGTTVYAGCYTYAS